MKVLIADKYPGDGVEALRGLGLEIVYEPDSKDAALAASLQASGADVLVVRSTKVTGEMLEKGRLSLVVRAGAGYNTIDVATASALGIYVSNCPGKNSIAVAELAFGLMLALDRRIHKNDSELRAGRWNKKEFGKARGLFGRTLGLVGMGSIGQEMAQRARGFGMPVIAWSRSLTPQKAAAYGVQYASSVEAVASACDVLSVHVALDKETRGRIGESVFDALRPGSLFINTARAEVVDHDALEKAMTGKGIRAGLDVYPDEPSGGTAEFRPRLAELDGFCGTHHIGASTDQAQDAIASEVTRILQTYQETGRVPNAVNLARRTPAKSLLVVRHRDRVGVLAHVLTELRASGINVQEMENVVFDGAQAAVARIHLDRDPGEEKRSSIESGHEDILEATLVPLT